MAQRYSRTDKGKWQEKHRPPSKPLVRIPDSNVSELIEKNKFTLIVTRDVDRARLRVQVNGLKPLIMCMDIELPSKAVVEIDLEYENLDKHCFLCKSLSHEDNACYLKLPTKANGERRHTSTSQQNTLEKLEEEKRRQADRKLARQNQPSHREGARWPNFKVSRDAPSASHEVYSKLTSGRSSGFEENHRRYDDRTLRAYKTPSYENRSSQRRQQDPAPSNHTSQWQARGSQEPRHNHVSPSTEASSHSKRSPPAAAEVLRKRNLDSRLSDPRTSNANREDRLPVKERLSVHTQRTSSNEKRDSEVTLSQERLPATGRISFQTQRISSLERLEANVDSVRVHDVDDQILEAPSSHSPRNNLVITRPSSSNVFGSGRVGRGDRSPIRTLSDDRVHVSLRLRPLLFDNEEEDRQQTDLPSLSKAAGKRKADGQKTTKKTSRGLSQGVAVKRRRTTKGQNSPRRASPRQNSPRRDPPRRKLMADAIVAGGALFKLFKNSELKNHFTVPPIGLAGGLSLSWKDDIQVDILFSSPNIIDTRIEAFGICSFVLKNKPEIRQLVADHWSQEPFESVLSKIGRIRHNIIQWTRDKNLNSNRAIKKGQEDLEQALSSSCPDQELITKLTALLESAYRAEEVYWRQRSRILWLHSGDSNTGFFHAATRGRRATNNITVLEDGSGATVYKEDEIVRSISNYYSQLFTTQMSDSSLAVQERRFILHSPRQSSGTRWLLSKLLPDFLGYNRRGRVKGHPSFLCIRIPGSSPKRDACAPNTKSFGSPEDRRVSTNSLV
ncbi:hypothetical protein Bca52824_025016 [Brassica carinata]|uniref:Zinc knuckle CX2CX4HX4C domain-containing protein n=1 Tax=Brassica carinata TaxID=52824 RepID=A0A8X7VLK6_BRACI|nr:hypothetical protein Bca52824_025016 [Brassica carinata]